MITERRALDFPRQRCLPRSCLVLVRSIVMQAGSSGKDVADAGYSRFQDNADFDALPINPFVLYPRLVSVVRLDVTGVRSLHALHGGKV